ncbi:MAG: serine--tRNA ligase [Bacillota bacterium]
MLDLKLIRSNPDLVKEAAAKKRVEVDIDRILALDAERRSTLTEVEQLKARRNQASAEVARLKRAGQDPSHIIAEMSEVGDRIKALDERVRQIEAELEELLLQVPNIPDPDVPVGEDETGNVEVKRWGTPRTFDFTPRPHWEIGTALDGLDFERAAKVAGSRFVIMKGGISRLHRALVAWFIDEAVARGYREVQPGVVVNTASYYGSGQFPKFKEDVFSLAGTDYHLSSTAEVPLVNMHRDEILPAEALPIKYVGFSGCFRAEAGAAGRDTRGLVRMHYFEKVELVQFTRPEDSDAALEEMTRHAEELLEKLNIPYRRVLMCTGDMGFTQAKKYDVELWLPSYGRYVEVASCSNCRDFQARRASIRFRPHPKAKPEFVHTLNASGLALPRTVAAILENYQNADGTVTVPEVLRPYMGGIDRITS